MPKTKIISERMELLVLLATPGINITGILADLEEKVIVTYTDESSSAKNTNVVTAATTTCHARILLYKLLDRLQQSALYFDTDSVMYVEKRGQPILRCEEALGGLSDEVLQYGAGAEIISFASVGPKNYGYVVKLEDGTTKVIRKCKGISIKHCCSEETSFATLKKLITREVDEVKIGVKRKIERTKDHQLVSRDSTKRMRLVYDKRALIGVETRPWGTKEGVSPVVPDPNIRIPAWELRDHFAS
jgi:hypothetical protein